MCPGLNEAMRQSAMVAQQPPPYITPVIIGMDSLELSHAYNGVTEIPYSAILTDCFIRAHHIGSITVQHCWREANYVAHKLARHAFDSNLSIFWDSDPPSFIVPDEMNNVSVF